MTSLDLNGIIRCLEKVARILHDRPEGALKELRQISSYIDSQVPFRDGHTTRVNEYSLKIGKALGIPDKQKVILETAALLHDFGKIGIDESVLLKRGKLTIAEQKEIEMHVLRGYYSPCKNNHCQCYQTALFHVHLPVNHHTNHMVCPPYRLYNNPSLCYHTSGIPGYGGRRIWCLSSIYTQFQVCFALHHHNNCSLCQ